MKWELKEASLLDHGEKFLVFVMCVWFFFARNCAAVSEAAKCGKQCRCNATAVGGDSTQKEANGPYVKCHCFPME